MRDDIHEAYDSYAFSNDSSISVGTSPEGRKGTAGCSALSGCLNVQQLSDRIRAPAGENVSQQLDMTGLHKRIWSTRRIFVLCVKRRLLCPNIFLQCLGRCLFLSFGVAYWAKALESACGSC